MDKLIELTALMASRIKSLTRAADKLSRMAGASTDHRERAYLRNEARHMRNKAKLMQSRYDKIVKFNKENPITRQEDLTHHG